MYHLGYLASARQRVALGSIVSLVIIVVAYWFLRPRTPEMVCADAVHALIDGNAKSLVSLADPDELARLNLSEDAVRTFVGEILGRGRSELTGKFSLHQRQYADSFVFEINREGRTTDKSISPLLINVLDSPDKGWKLNLSLLLYYLCLIRSANTIEATERWNSMRDRHGILGTRQNDGRYTSYTPRTSDVIPVGQQ
jgi:hypothetical protein